MKKKVYMTSIILLLVLTGCSGGKEFRTAEDEKLYRSIEGGGDLEEVRESVEAGARIDDLKRGRLVSVNMVTYAAQNGRRDIAEWLIGNGADVNYSTPIVGQTLLMSMAAAGEYDLCRILIENGADVLAKDRLSDTAMEYAFRAGARVSEEQVDRIVTLLLENGAEITESTLKAALSGYSGKGDSDKRYGLMSKIIDVLAKKNGYGEWESEPWFDDRAIAVYSEVDIESNEPGDTGEEESCICRCCCH